MTDAPNVLWVVADDLRFDAVGPAGNDEVHTPTLDSLADEGCAFARHHNQGADQMAVCVPARSMLHSGRSLFGLEGPGGMTTDHPTLPEAFGEAGYRTFATGKWHNGVEAFDRSFQRGEDVFFGGMGDHWNLPVCSPGAGGEYPDPRPTRFDFGTGHVRTVERVYDRYASGTHSSELFADAAADFVRSHAASDDDRPLFAYLATTAPHDPRSPPGEYLDRYDPDGLSLAGSVRPEHPFDNGRLDVRDERLERRPRDPEHVRRHLADYYAMVEHLDAQLGRVLDALAAAGEREDTLVAFTADHGLAVGRHGLMGKQNLYEHSVRVPLLLAGPGVPEGTRCDALTTHRDLYPTLCDLAGLEVPRTVDGESLVPAMRDGAEPRDALLLAYEDCQRAVREDRFKLIEYEVDGDRHTQLFDLASDSAETENLADDEAYADERDRLRDRLRELRTAADDPTVAE